MWTNVSKRDNIRYFREEANLRGVMATIRISDIPLPTVQNSNQVYVFNIST